jgi:hypothetical protein
MPLKYIKLRNQKINFPDANTWEMQGQISFSSYIITGKLFFIRIRVHINTSIATAFIPVDRLKRNHMKTEFQEISVVNYCLRTSREEAQKYLYSHIKIASAEK